MTCIYTHLDSRIGVLAALAFSTPFIDKKNIVFTILHNLYSRYRYYLKQLYQEKIS
jgi:hypothetical protein